MSDDPREVLKAAGVECAEVNDWNKSSSRGGFKPPEEELIGDADAAILALARLVVTLIRE